MAIEDQELGNSFFSPELMSIASQQTLADARSNNPREIEGIFLLRNTNLIQGRVIVENKSIDWTLEIPEGQLAYGGVAHFISGYGGIKHTSGASRHALAERGIATLTSEPALGGFLPTFSDLQDPQLLHTKTQVAIAANLRERQKEIAQSVPNGNNIDIDMKLLLPHSMGGASAVGYAENEPGAVDMIINLATIGRGAPTLHDIAKISPSDLYNSLRHEVIPVLRQNNIQMNVSNLYQIIHYYARIRAVLEAHSCLSLDLRERQTKLRDNSIAIRDIDFEHDIIVPTPAWRADVMMPDAGHLAPLCKAPRVASMILQLERERQLSTT